MILYILKDYIIIFIFNYKFNYDDVQEKAHSGMECVYAFIYVILKHKHIHDNAYAFAHIRVAARPCILD